MSLLCNGAEPSAAKPNPQRFSLRDGTEGEYVGMFSADAKFRTSSKLIRLLDKNATAPPTQVQQSYVPVGMLQSYQRVVADYQPPRHAAVLPAFHSPEGKALDSIVTFAYGHQRVLAAPQAITSDSQQRVIVSDPTISAVHILDPRGKTSFSILGGPGGRLQRPGGVAVDGEDNIYIADSARGLILVYDRYGRFLRRVGDFHGENIFENPTGIAIDRRRGRLYVADGPRDVVFLLDLEGNVLKQVGQDWKDADEDGIKIRNTAGPREFDQPTEIAVGEHELAVLDSGGTRVHIMDLSFNSIGSFKTTRAANEKVYGLAIDREGDIYVSFSATSTIKAYDRSGRALGAFGQTGARMGEFLGPAGLWVDATNQIHIADTQNARIQVFQLKPRTPAVVAQSNADAGEGN